jgi:hypothetical protein
MTIPRTSAAQHFGTLRRDCPTCGGHLYDLRAESSVTPATFEECAVFLGDAYTCRRAPGMLNTRET